MLCVRCSKEFETNQPNAKYCLECKHLINIERQKDRYLSSGIEAIKLMMQKDNSFFVLGCEEVYKNLFGGKIKMRVSSDCDMVERRKKIFLNKIKRMNEELAEIIDLLELDEDKTK